MKYKKSISINMTFDVFKDMAKKKGAEKCIYRIKDNIIQIMVKTYTGELYVKALLIEDFLSMSIMQINTFVEKYF